VAVPARKVGRVVPHHGSRFYVISPDLRGVP
jgi:hypothetical protein